MTQVGNRIIPNAILMDGTGKEYSLAGGGSYSSVVPYVANTPQTAGLGILLAVSVAGNVSLTTAAGQTIVIPVVVGLLVLPFGVTTLNSSGTTATLAAYNLS